MGYLIFIGLVGIGGYFAYKYRDQIKQVIATQLARFKKPQETTSPVSATPTPTPTVEAPVEAPKEPQGTFSPFPDPVVVVPDPPTPTEPQGQFGPFPVTPTDPVKPVVVEPTPVVVPVTPSAPIQVITGPTLQPMLPVPHAGDVSQLRDYEQGVTYYFLWPTNGGILGIDADSGSGAGTQIEIGAAPTAGDWEYAKTPVTIVGPFGPTQYMPYASGSGNVDLGRPPTIPFPLFGFFRVTNMPGKMIVQISLTS